MGIGAPVYVIGDVHGHALTLRRLLRECGLIDADGGWTGGAARLWLLGDYVDRGPDGVGVIDLIRRMQSESTAAGGAVQPLLGNHEALILAARRFGSRFTESGVSFRGAWKMNGGRDSDLDALTEDHVEWLVSLPAIARHDDWLLLHADATFYLDFGSTIDAINEALRGLLQSDEERAWEYLLTVTAQRRAFDGSAPDSEERLSSFLDTFGVTRLVHGHTPIDYMRGIAAADVTDAYVYADGRCVNVDGGLYRGGPGFVYQMRDE